MSLLPCHFSARLQNSSVVRDYLPAQLSVIFIVPASNFMLSRRWVFDADRAAPVALRGEGR